MPEIRFKFSRCYSFRDWSLCFVLFLRFDFKLFSSIDFYLTSRSASASDSKRRRHARNQSNEGRLSNVYISISIWLQAPPPRAKPVERGKIVKSLHQHQHPSPSAAATRETSRTSGDCQTTRRRDPPASAWPAPTRAAPHPRRAAAPPRRPTAALPHRLPTSRQGEIALRLGGEEVIRWLWLPRRRVRFPAAATAAARAAPRPWRGKNILEDAKLLFEWRIFWKMKHGEMLVFEWRRSNISVWMKNILEDETWWNISVWMKNILEDETWWNISVWMKNISEDEKWFWNMKHGEMLVFEWRIF